MRAMSPPRFAWAFSLALVVATFALYWAGTHTQYWRTVPAMILL